MGIRGANKIVSDGLVLYLDGANTESYPGTGLTWSDLSATVVQGSLLNGPTFNTGGGGHFSFDGSNDYVDMGQVNFTSDVNITFDIVVYVDSSQAQYANIFDYNHGGGGFVLQQYWPNATTSWYFYTGFSFLFFSIPTNQIIYLTIVKSGTTCTAYIDGEFSTSSGVSNSLTATGKTLHIARLVGGGRNFNGKIYSFKAYNRALTASEVFQNYDVTKIRYGI
jgi:hypothetical protein